MIAQAAAVAQGSVSSGCSRQSAAGDGRGASGGGVAHGSSVSSAAGGRVAGSGRRRRQGSRRRASAASSLAEVDDRASVAGRQRASAVEALASWREGRAVAPAPHSVPGFIRHGWRFTVATLHSGWIFSTARCNNFFHPLLYSWRLVLFPYSIADSVSSCIDSGRGGGPRSHGWGGPLAAAPPRYSDHQIWEPARIHQLHGWHRHHSAQPQAERVPRPLNQSRTRRSPARNHPRLPLSPIN
jgi:hypothetical protein